MQPVKQQYGYGLYAVAGGFVWCDDARTGQRVGPVYVTVSDAMLAIWTGRVDADAERVALPDRAAG